MTGPDDVTEDVNDNPDEVIDDGLTAEIPADPALPDDPEPDDEGDDDGSSPEHIEGE